MLCNVGINCYQNARKKSTEVQLCHEAGRFDPRLIVSESDTALSMFKQVLTKLVDTKRRTTEQADVILTKNKKFVSEMKQFHHENLLVSSLERSDWMLSSIMY